MVQQLPGLTSAEAADRLKQNGANLITGYRLSIWRTLGKQIRSPLVYFLILAALISFFLSGPADGLTITVILLVNTVLSFYQEYKSEKFIEKLHNLIKKTATVRRDNRVVKIPEAEIVPGDSVILEEGDIAPADGEIKFSEGLAIDESLLTGETFPADKAKGDRAFMGTTVLHGYAEMEVTATGMQTRLGKIAGLSTALRKKSQYEENIAQLSNFLMLVTVIALTLVFGLHLGIRGVSVATILNVFLFTLALAISVVPEALPAISTLTLSAGALKLAREHVVVKRLSAVEDLGNIEVLCTDKTGTITQNMLTVKEAVSKTLAKLFAYSYFCLEQGDTIDTALRRKIPADLVSRNKNLKLIAYLPFDPRLRRRYALIGDGKQRVLVVMGSPAEVFRQCTDDGKSIWINKIDREEQEGLRHLVVAYKKVSNSFTLENQFDDGGLEYLGYFSLDDPLRPTAQNAISLARKLAVQVKIISGDSLGVARHAAVNVGLLDKNDLCFTGPDLEKMSAEEFTRACREGLVFARIMPEQKYKIIETLKSCYVVGYLGDGINDAPALKAAHVGIAVSGAAEVATEAADILLLKPDLKVVIDGIESGRRIFANIDKYIKHTMVSNWGNFFAVAIISLVTDFLPLLPVQLILTGLLSDLPQLAVASDNVDHEELHRPAKHRLADLLLLPLLLGGVTTLLNLSFYFYLHPLPIETLRTAWFVLLTLTNLVVIFSVRRRGSMFRGLPPGMVLTAATLLVCLFVLLLPYLPFAAVFHFTALDFRLLALIVAITAIYLFVLDIFKIAYYGQVGKKRPEQPFVRPANRLYNQQYEFRN